MPSWLLCHPPLLSAAVLRPLARELRASGRPAYVPDLRRTVETAARWGERYARGAREAANRRGMAGDVDVVLGYSGAGVVLPAVAAAVGARRVVWVDAVVPVVRGSTVPSAELRTMVAGLARGGMLPPWPTWWGPAALADLLPDASVRAEITAEAPSLPMDLYDEPVPVPEQWPDTDVTYVHLSPAYDRDAGEAARRGWRVVGDGMGLHTDVATDPAAVLRLLG